MINDELTRLCDATLRKGLPASLTALIRRLLERGEHPADIMAFCRRAGVTMKGSPLMTLAIEAEIAAVSNELRARRN